MSTLIQKPISIKSPTVWEVASRKSKYLLLGDHNDRLVCGRAEIHITFNDDTPLVFYGKIRKKTQNNNPNLIYKYIQIPQICVPLIPKNVKKIHVEIVRSIP